MSRTQDECVKHHQVLLELGGLRLGNLNDSFSPYTFFVQERETALSIEEISGNCSRCSFNLPFSGSDYEHLLTNALQCADDGR